MRGTTIAARMLALLMIAGCGSPDAGSPQQPTSAPTLSQAASATLSSTSAPAALQAAPTAPLQASTPTAPQATPTALPQATTSKETAMPDQPATPPDPARPAFQATPLVPESTPPIAPLAQPTGVVVSQPLNPTLAALVDGAKGDLAKHQSVPIEQIDLVEVQSVTWPDGSLGCPQPGMVYPQVQVDGLLIRLSVGGRVFNYHSGGRRPPFLCEQGSQDKLPAPAPGSSDQ